MRQNGIIPACAATILLLSTMGVTAGAAQSGKIVHDAEYCILEAQNGKIWAVENSELDRKLAAPRAKYGQPPNIIHYMWDDQPPMAFGDPIYQKIRGYETPNPNQLAAEGNNLTLPFPASWRCYPGNLGSGHRISVILPLPLSM